MLVFHPTVRATKDGGAVGRLLGGTKISGAIPTFYRLRDALVSPSARRPDLV